MPQPAVCVYLRTAVITWGRCCLFIFAESYRCCWLCEKYDLIARFDPTCLKQMTVGLLFKMTMGFHVDKVAVRKADDALMLVTRHLLRSPVDNGVRNDTDLMPAHEGKDEDSMRLSSDEDSSTESSGDKENAARREEDETQILIGSDEGERCGDSR